MRTQQVNEVYNIMSLRDSLVDAGNNNYINSTTEVQANYGPYGETFFKYPTGRFSNGRIIPDFIAEFANLPFITPYLYPGYHQYTDGANFASAGAGALIETHQGLGLSIKRVHKLLPQKLVKTRGLKPGLKYVHTAVRNCGDSMVSKPRSALLLKKLVKTRGPKPGLKYVHTAIGNYGDSIVINGIKAKVGSPLKGVVG
nr:gdsl esterase/lipase 5 [Quercus suber]